MTLFQMDDTFSSKEIAQGALRVTLTADYLSAYLETPFLGGDELDRVRARRHRR